MQDQIVIKSAKLLSWQKDFARAFENMDKGETLVVCSARQIGKSFTLTQILLHVAVNRPKSRSIYISPTNDSSRKFFNDIKEMVEGHPLVKKLNESLLTIEFKNGSSIVLRSAESKLRGNSCRKGGILAVDEAQFLPDQIWEVILPFTNVDKSRKVIISTPKLPVGKFYEFYCRALAKERGYTLIETRNYDTSMFLSDDQREEYRKILSPQAFKSEILGEWLKNDECLFGDYRSVFFDPKRCNPEVVGIDWSNNGGDNTVLSGFNSDKQQCMLEIVTGIKDPVERAMRVADIINQHPSIRVVLAEKNSIGEVYISVLKKFLKNASVVREFVTTNDSKKRIIERLITAISQRSITLLPNPQMDMELSGYEMQPLAKGNYTFNGKKDDCIMATAFAVDYLFKQSGGYSSTSARSAHKPKLSQIYG